MPYPALKALLSAVALIGVEPAPPPPAAVRAAARDVPEREILRLPLSDVIREQSRAWLTQPVGSSNVGFALALAPEAELWAKIRGSRTNAFALAQLSGGVETDAGDGPFRLSYEDGFLRAVPLDGSPPWASVSAPGRLRALYDVSLQVLLTPYAYSVLYEDGAASPASVCLLRQDDAGALHAVCRSPDQLLEPSWFVSVDGTSYGMKLEGQELVFYSKPASSAVGR